MSTGLPLFRLHRYNDLLEFRIHKYRRLISPCIYSELSASLFVTYHFHFSDTLFLLLLLTTRLWTSMEQPRREVRHIYHSISKENYQLSKPELEYGQLGNNMKSNQVKSTSSPLIPRSIASPGRSFQSHLHGKKSLRNLYLLRRLLLCSSQNCY